MTTRHKPTGHYILSLDLGIKNLGFAVIGYIKTGPKHFNDLTISFDIFNIESQFKKKIDIVNNRCDAILKFFTDLLNEYGRFDYVIIERQVNRNTMAMELMYACAMACKTLCNVDMISFDPKDKFLKLGLPYTIEKKAHKRLSTRMARILINNYWPSLRNSFESYTKKDDISDAINQVLTWMFVNGFINYTIDEYVTALHLNDSTMLASSIQTNDNNIHANGDDVADEADDYALPELTTST